MVTVTAESRHGLHAGAPRIQSEISNSSCSVLEYVLVIWVYLKMGGTRWFPGGLSTKKKTKGDPYLSLFLVVVRSLLDGQEQPPLERTLGFLRWRGTVSSSHIVSRVEWSNQLFTARHLTRGEI